MNRNTPTGGHTVSVVAKQALEAYKERQDEFDRERKLAEQQRELRAQEMRERVRCVVLDRSPLPRWFPDVRWVTVDCTESPQISVVVRPNDDPSILLKVTLLTYPDHEPPDFMIKLVSDAGVKPGGVRWCDEGAVREPADLGQLLLDRERQFAPVPDDAKETT